MHKAKSSLYESFCCKKTARENFDFVGLFKAPLGIDTERTLVKIPLADFFLGGYTWLRLGIRLVVLIALGGIVVRAGPSGDAK